MSDVFTLHGSPHSQFTYKVALMLSLSRQPFGFRYVSFQKGVHLTPESRELSRWGQVPVLQHGNHTLVQSGGILEYLAATLGKFGSRDHTIHQRIREWLYWNTDRLAPPIYGCYGINWATEAAPHRVRSRNRSISSPPRRGGIERTRRQYLGR